LTDTPYFICWRRGSKLGYSTYSWNLLLFHLYDNFIDQYKNEITKSPRSVNTCKQMVIYSWQMFRLEFELGLELCLKHS
jgi:thymidylate synthase